MRLQCQLVHASNLFYDRELEVIESPLQRKFRSVSGDIYVGNVYHETGNYVAMNNYTVWYYGDSAPYQPESPLDWIDFTVDSELPL